MHYYPPMKTLRPKFRITQISGKFLEHLSSYAEFFFLYYLKRKVIALSLTFERNKNYLVRFFLMKRGRYNRPFLHLTTMGVLGLGVLIGPYLADTYPVFTTQVKASTDLANAENQQQSISVSDNIFSTDASDKPRDKVLTYIVQKGDTISTIAKKFNISIDTIKWANDLTTDDIGVGDELQILPVSGILHKVSKGDTVHTIAKKYDTDAQKIVDFPFNEFANAETFALVDGQELLVPDGIKPDTSNTQRNVIKQQQQSYIAQVAPQSVTAGGFSFPLPGNSGISQYASWYHMALDITGNYGAPIVAANSGHVASVHLGSYDGGYGNNVSVQGDNGYMTHYAHMMNANVGVGDSVIAGKTIVGWVGLTGRTTGPHLHFEIIKDGQLLNPLPFLQ